MNICVIGSVFVDQKAYPYGKFIPDGRNPGYEKLFYGGVGRNVAENMARLGMNSKFVGLVDDDGVGSDVLTALGRSGVDTRFVRKCKSGMGKWIAIFDETGDVAASISIRPDLSPIADIIETHHKEIFEDADAVVLELDVEECAVERAFYYAKKYNKPVYCVVSIMSITLERRKYFKDIDCFVCNLQEAEMLFGEPFSERDTADIKAEIEKRFAETGFKKLIVTLGKRGSVYFEAGASGYCPAAHAYVVDTTGAGDAFASGAFSALAMKCSLAEAAYMGTKAAAGVIESEQNVIYFS